MKALVVIIGALGMLGLFMAFSYWWEEDFIPDGLVFLIIGVVLVAIASLAIAKIK